MATRPKLNRIWASSNSNLIRDPGEAKYLIGWVSEIPTYQVLNFLQNKVDTTFLAIAERGIPEWGVDIQYQKGSLVWDDLDATIYVASVASPNRTLAPSKNISQWVPSSIQLSRKQYTDLNTLVDNHITDFNNPHGVTAAQLSAYTKAEIEQIVAQYRALVAEHANNTNNPHKLTAKIIGAVPVTGGEYTGLVSFPHIDLGAGTGIGVGGDDTLTIAYKEARLKLLSSGKVSVGIIGPPASFVVTEQTFPTLRLDNQPSYAIPPAVFEIDLINSVSIRKGFGYMMFSSDSTDTTPKFDIYGEFIPRTDGGYKVNTGGIILNTGEKTIVADVRLKNVGDINKNFTSFGDSDLTITLRTSGSNSVMVVTEMTARGGGSVNYWGTNNVITWLPNTVKRIATTCSSREIRLYIDGVLMASRNLAGINLEGREFNMFPFINPRTSNGLATICRFKSFAKVLSPQQVSML